jgi:ABC-2 type transport system permease protein
MTGIGALLRLALRLDRVRLPIWVVLLGLTPMVTAAQYKSLYPDEASLRAVSSVIDNQSLVALSGPLFRLSLGALTAWKVGVTEFILIAVISVLTVVRHSRTEEETGRLELVGSTVVGRYAALSAALLTAALVDIATGVLVTLGLLGVGMPAGGSVAFGAAVALVGLVFAAVAAVAAQLAESGRSANGIAIAVLGAAYLLRAIGDSGPSWLSWLSPVGWGMRIRPYAGEQWWVAALLVPLALVLGTVAYAVVARRDLGAGLLPQRPAPATGPGLGSPFALAWRLHRGVLIGWLIAMAVTGLVFGGSAYGIGKADIGAQMKDYLARLGGRGALVNAYLAATIGITGLVVAAYTVQSMLRMRAEESSGRVEPLLATRVGRIRWAASHLVFSVFGTALLLGVAGAMAGLAYGAQLHDVGGQVGRLTGAMLAQLPAAWVLAGLGTALFGLVPRLSAGVSWGALIACMLLLELGALLKLNHWVVDASPFAHIPKLPGGTVSATPLVVLVVVAVALAVVGLAGFRRRDGPVG